MYAEVPETAFSCDGQVDGGKYATLLTSNIYAVAILVLKGKQYHLKITENEFMIFAQGEYSNRGLL